MKKNFIKGFVAGALVFGVATSFATVTYNAITATFPILINGQTWESDKPVVVIDGSTYLPLKAIGDVLNVNVNWNNDLKQVEIGEAPISQPVSTETNINVTPTLGQENALKSAKEYLDYSAFSYKGLVEQLEYEGFTTEEATYGVDNCQANWNEQAAKCAKEYLDYSSFSRQGLIEQLEYEGFTHEQAIYGVESVGY